MKIDKLARWGIWTVVAFLGFLLLKPISEVSNSYGATGKKFEYLVISVPRAVPNPGYEDKSQAISELFNKYGADGWELVSYSGGDAFFKR